MGIPNKSFQQLKSTVKYSPEDLLEIIYSLFTSANSFAPCQITVMYYMASKKPVLRKKDLTQEVEQLNGEIRNNKKLLYRKSFDRAKFYKVLSSLYYKEFIEMDKIEDEMCYKIDIEDLIIKKLKRGD